MHCLCHSSRKTIRAFIKWSVDINLYKFKLIIHKTKACYGCRTTAPTVVVMMVAFHLIVTFYDGKS